MGGYFDTRGTSEHGEVVCSQSNRKHQPCRKTACKHHICHVKASQSGTEFFVRNLKKEGACYEQKSSDSGRIEESP